LQPDAEPTEDLVTLASAPVEAEDMQDNVLMYNGKIKKKLLVA
jgi:hypothetical protein